jgi:hypothetical protein
VDPDLNDVVTGQAMVFDQAPDRVPVAGPGFERPHIVMSVERDQTDFGEVVGTRRHQWTGDGVVAAEVDVEEGFGQLLCPSSHLVDQADPVDLGQRPVPEVPHLHSGQVGPGLSVKCRESVETSSHFQRSQGGV